MPSLMIPPAPEPMWPTFRRPFSQLSTGLFPTPVPKIPDPGSWIDGVTVDVRTGGGTERLPLADVARVDLADLAAMRSPKERYEQRNYSGHYCSNTLCLHQWFESFNERDHLFVCDWEAWPAVICQPLKFNFPKGVGPSSHVPDTLLFDLDLQPVLVNVKGREDLADSAEMFSVIDAVAEHLAWQHVVFVPPATVVRRNIRFLSSFGAPWPLLEGLEERAVRELTEPFSLRWLYAIEDDELVTSTFRAIWLRRIHVDVLSPLSANSICTPLANAGVR